MSAALKYLRNVATLALDQERCTGCLRCLEVCPRGALGCRGKLVAVVDRDACIECGACAANCRTGAIAVRSGVGCATAVFRGLLRGGEPCCGGSAAAADCCGDATAAADTGRGCSAAAVGQSASGNRTARFPIAEAQAAGNREEPESPR